MLIKDSGTTTRQEGTFADEAWKPEPWIRRRGSMLPQPPPGARSSITDDTWWDLIPTERYYHLQPVRDAGYYTNTTYAGVLSGTSPSTSIYIIALVAVDPTPNITAAVTIEKLSLNPG